MLSITSIVAALALVGGARAVMYGQPVINLDSRSFKEALSVEHAGMVAFVAPWCGHCKALGPEYEAAATSFSPLIPFYAVDCDEDQNKRLCAQYEVKGFPTIKAFPKGLKGAVKDYQGERKRGALVEYAKSLVPDKVKKLRVEEGGAVDSVLQKFLDEKPELPHALLVHPSAPSIPFLWKVLGHRYASKMHLGFIRDTTSHSVLSNLGIYDPQDTSRDATRVIAWKAGAEKAEILEHQVMKFNALLEFLQAHLDGVPPPVPEPKEEKEVPPPQSNAGRRARMKEKLEEEERRDQARREKMASAAAAAASASASESTSLSDDADGDIEPEKSEEQPATPVDAVPPAPQEDVEDEPISHARGEGSAPDPEPEEGVSVEEEEAEGVQARETPEVRTHEEL